jgi:hypothetical protein
MFCQKCGNQLTDESEFCQKCGNQLNKKREEIPTNDNISPVRKGNIKWYLSLPVISLSLVFFPLSIFLYVKRFIATRGTRKHKATIIYAVCLAALFAGMTALVKLEERKFDEIDAAIAGKQFETAYNLIVKAEKYNESSSRVRDSYIKYYEAQGLYDDAANILIKYCKKETNESDLKSAISQLNKMTNMVSDDKKSEISTLTFEIEEQKRLLAEAKEREKAEKEAAAKAKKEAEESANAEAKTTTDRTTATSNRSSGGQTTPESDFTVTLTGDSKGVVITAYNGNAKNVVIPATIQGLPVRVIGFITVKLISGRGAFESNRTITSVVIPEGVTNIDFRAFHGCTSLSSVTLPSTLEIIENAAFSGCSSLKSITLPKNLSKIGQVAFASTGLTSFPDSWPAKITEIEQSTFNESKISGHLVIPEGIKYINTGAFKGTPITSLTLRSVQL